MEHLDSWESPSTSRDDQKVEPIKLLEENWFLNNMFRRRTAMVRCASDPTPLNCCHEMAVRSPGDKRSSSMSRYDSFVHRNLLPTPSLESAEVDHNKKQTSIISTSEVLPPWQTSKIMMQDTSVGRHRAQKESKVDIPNEDIKNPYDKQSSSITGGLCEDHGPIHQDLVRTPSLPPSMGRKKVAGMEEGRRGSRKLMRHASLNPSVVLPPQHNYKTMTVSPSIRRERFRSEAKVDVRNKETVNLSRRKTMSDLEIEELRGFMDLGFTFNEEDQMNPSVVNLIPGLKVRNEANRDEDKVRRPYLSEAWAVERSAPPMPNWVDKKPVGDMKEQLKYWARAVASNARQEC